MADNTIDIGVRLQGELADAFNKHVDDERSKGDPNLSPTTVARALMAAELRRLGKFKIKPTR